MPKGKRQIDDKGPYEWVDKDRTIRYYTKDETLACLHTDMPGSLCVQCIKRMVICYRRPLIWQDASH